MGTLFGELSTAVQFFIAFLIVLALIVLTFWAIRRFGGIGLGAGAARGRQPRLAVIDAAAVDGRRRLVLIRRDNVEHLLMIGGPSDITSGPDGHLWTGSGVNVIEIPPGADPAVNAAWNADPRSRLGGVIRLLLKDLRQRTADERDGIRLHAAHFE